MTSVFIQVQKHGRLIGTMKSSECKAHFDNMLVFLSKETEMIAFTVTEQLDNSRGKSIEAG